MLPENVKKQLWNKRVIVRLIVIGAFGTVPKVLLRGLEQLEIRVRAETITSSAALTSTIILIYLFI